MKKLHIFLSLFSILPHLNLYSQEWIPFDWIGDSIGNQYYDKISLSLPVKIDSLTYPFKMQLDLGATQTHFYEKNINELFNKHSYIKEKIDSSYVFWINNTKNPYLKNCNLTLGNYKLGNRYIGLYKNFGTSTPIDSLTTSPLIGTIAPDIFKNKILIIDYPNKRIGIFETLPTEYEKASFSKFEENYGRIFIHFLINGKDERLMFDTGSSIFSLITTKNRAKKISSKKITDELTVNSWGNNLKVYEKTVNKEIFFGNNLISSDKVYYIKKIKFKLLFHILDIWGITGNSIFLKNTIIIDYKTKQFGLK